jgi:ERF superfamily
MSNPDIQEKPAPTMVAIPQTMEVSQVAPASFEQIEAPAPAVGAQIGKLATAIANVMKDIGIVGKDGTNTFHNYKYAKMEDVLRRVTPLIAREGIVIVQTEIDRSMFDNDRAIAVKYAFTICHASGEVWPERPVQTGLSRCRDSKGGFDDKCINKCHTAARKYFILALFQVPTGVDDDADADAVIVNGKSADVQDNWPRGSIHQNGDYAGGTPERLTKPKQEGKYSRMVNAAMTHLQRADMMVHELEICERVPELDAMACEIEARQDYKNLPQTMKDRVAKAYAATLARLKTEVVHDSDDMEPRPATPEDEPAPVPISQQAINKRENHVPRLQQVDNWADFPELPPALDRNGRR